MVRVGFGGVVGLVLVGFLSNSIFAAQGSPKQVADCMKDLWKAAQASRNAVAAEAAVRARLEELAEGMELDDASLKRLVRAFIRNQTQRGKPQTELLETPLVFSELGPSAKYTTFKNMNRWNVDVFAYDDESKGAHALVEKYYEGNIVSPDSFHHEALLTVGDLLLSTIFTDDRVEACYALEHAPRTLNQLLALTTDDIRAAAAQIRASGAGETPGKIIRDVNSLGLKFADQ